MKKSATKKYVRAHILETVAAGIMDMPGFYPLQQEEKQAAADELNRIESLFGFERKFTLADGRNYTPQTKS